MSALLIRIPVMSMGLSVYLLDLGAARGAIGSGDEKLRRMIGGRFKRQIAAADVEFDDEVQGGAPSRYEALRAVIEGGPFDSRYGFQYGYAYQLVCEFYGKPLFNNDFSPYRGSWLEEVDAGLAQLGIKAVELTEFAYGAPPSPLPRPEWVPGYGEWSPEKCREALDQWENTTPDERQALDSEVREAIESCVEWLRAAQKKEGFGVAGFNH